MVEEIYNKYGIDDIEIRGLDITERTCVDSESKKKISHYYIRLNKKIKFLIAKLNRQKTIAIIFVGGGIVKYKYQECQHSLEVMITFATKRKIPVMLSTVGIEAYDEENSECLRVKNAINKECVKLITTWDDIRTLKDCYIENKSIISEKVADLACSYADYYKLSIEHLKYIGLGMARKNLFWDNEVDIIEQDLLELWKNICIELSERGYKYRIFTNGTIPDFNFVENFYKYMEWDISMNPPIKRPLSTHELADTILRFDAVIVCRLHAAIIAYSYGIPTVELVWNDKKIMFGENIGY